MAEQRLYAVALTTYRDSGGTERTRWTRIGSAWQNSDGTRETAASFNIELDAFPASGRMQLRQETPVEAQQREDRRRERDSSSRDNNREDAQNRSGYGRR